jgi:hypothetical protein
LPQRRRDNFELILLPGFAAAYVVQQLATRRTQSDLERVIEALLF